MGGACSTYGERGGAWRDLVDTHEGKRYYVEDLQVDKSIILKRISKQ
jgi:hypothetical protein